MLRRIALAALVFLFSASAAADEVILNNGDRVTGTVTRVGDGTITIENTPFGTVTASLADVKSFTAQQSVATATPSATTPGATTLAATTPAATTTGAQAATPPMPRSTTVAAAPAPATPPPPKRWSGSVVGTGIMTRGNSDTETFKITADAVHKGDSDTLSLAGGYTFAQQRDPDTGSANTTADSWFGQARYDHLTSPRLYEYAMVRFERDRIAQLDLRATPGVGVGYRWILSPEMNFNTEIGITWIYEQYDNGGNNDNFALRLAYHFDRRLNDKVNFVHNVEWLPNITDAGDYILNVDAGVRAMLTAAIFTEFKVEWRRDSTPAPGAEKDDLRYTVGVGFKF